MSEAGTGRPRADGRLDHPNDRGDPLGWYALARTVYVNLDVARDNDRLPEVLNHERVHRLLVSTTSYGVVQYLVNAAWADPEPNERMGLLGGLLATSARWAHEAAATYCSLTDVPDGLREVWLCQLPGPYREAYDALAQLFQQRSFDKPSRVAVALALVARALQTRLLDDWVPEGLSDATRLRSYLSDAANSPNERLREVIIVASTFDDAELTRWVGTYTEGPENGALTLEPAVPESLGSLQFTALPRNERLGSTAASVFESLRPDIPPESRSWRLDRSISWLDIQTVAVKGHIHGTFQMPDETLDDDWCSQVDFALVGPNVHSVPMRKPDDPREIGVLLPGRARLSFFRPDVAAARMTRAPIESLETFFARASNLADATLCVGASDLHGLSPFDGWGPFPRVDRDYVSQFLQFIVPRRVIAHGTGDFTWLIDNMGSLAQSEDDTFTMCVLPDSSDTPLLYVLLRSAVGCGPMFIHPTVRPEWERWEKMFVAEYPVRLEPDPREFFSQRTAMRGDFLRFRRFFRGDLWQPNEWRRYEERGGDLL